MDKLMKIRELKKLTTYQSVEHSLDELFQFMFDNCFPLGSILKRNTLVHNHHLYELKISPDTKIVTRLGLTNILNQTIHKHGTIKKTADDLFRWNGFASNVDFLKSLQISNEKYFCIHYLNNKIHEIIEPFPADYKLAFNEITFNFTKKPLATQIASKSLQGIVSHHLSTQHALHSLLKLAVPTSRFGRYLLANINAVNHSELIALCVKPKQTYLNDLNTRVYLSQYSQQDLLKHKTLLLSHRRIRYYDSDSVNGLPNIITRDDAILYLYALLHQIKFKSAR